MAQTTYPNTQRSINGQLAALLQLESAKEKLMRSGVAPNTVAGQQVQQAQAMLGRPPQPQPQQPQPPQQPQAAGIQDLLPGVQQQAMQAQQAAQPATQGDMDQLRQMMQQAQGQGQPMAEGGIAALAGADVEMAEGGVVGYAGPTGSYVRSPEEVEQAEGEKESTIQKVLNWLRGKGTTYDPEAPAAASPRDELAAEVARESRGKPPPDLARIGAVPQPRAQPRPSAGSGVAQPTAQPAAPTVGPMEETLLKFLQEEQAQRKQGFQELKGLAKLQPKTQEELDFVKRQEEEVARRRAGVEGRRQQFLDLEKLREEAGRPGKYEDLAAFLSRTGGARSGLAGLAQATQAQVGIDAARRKEAQAALDRRREYFDLLEQQRDAIEDRDVAIKQGQMDRARAAQERVDAINKGIATLRVQTSAQMLGPIIQAGQSAENTRARIAAQERMNRERTAAALAAARLKASQVKPPPGMTMTELEKFHGMINKEFNSQRPGPAALAYLKGLPAKAGGLSGEQLVRDIVNGNIKPGSPQWVKEVEPKLAIGKLEYAQQLRAQTKYGAQPIPYGTAASMLGIAPAAAEDEDED